jgi:hypothetical protein
MWMICWSKQGFKSKSNSSLIIIIYKITYAYMMSTMQFSCPKVLKDLEFLHSGIIAFQKPIKHPFCKLIIVLQNGTASLLKVHEWLSQRCSTKDRCHPLTSSTKGIHEYHLLW